MMILSGSGGGVGLGDFVRSVEEEMVCVKMWEKCMSSEPCLGWPWW
jgi:hypothetical protein